MGVILRADLAGPKRVGWTCPVRAALKRTPVQDFNSFSIRFYYIISTIYIKKLETYFALLYFWTFAVCTTLFRIDKNFVKTDTVRNATHITRCSFLPPCIFFLPTCFSADLPPFCYINQNHFSYFIHTKTSKVTKKKFSDGISQRVDIFSAKNILIHMYPLTPSPLVVFIY